MINTGELTELINRNGIFEYILINTENMSLLPEENHTMIHNIYCVIKNSKDGDNLMIYQKMISKFGAVHGRAMYNTIKPYVLKCKKMK